MDRVKRVVEALPLTVRLTVATTIMVIIAIAVVTVVSLLREQRTFRTELEHQTRILLETLAAAATDPLYRLDTEFLGGIVAGLRAEPSIVQGRIYDKNARIVADAHDPDKTYLLDADPFGQHLLNSDGVTFEWQSDRLVAGRPIIIGRERIGAVSITLSTAPLSSKVASVRNQGLIVAVIAASIGTLLVTLFSKSIAQPLQQLTEATQHIAQGNFEHQIPPRGGRELAQLAESFNSMTRRIDEMVKQQQAQQHVLEATNQELEKYLAEVTQAHEVQDELQQTIREMSLPILSVAEGIILLPLIGSIDSARSQQLMDRMLREINRRQAHVVILDISGVPVVDTQVANVLLKTTRAAGLLGARVVMCGIAPEVAEVIVGLGINTDVITKRSDLHAALAYALQLKGQAITRIPARQN